MAHILVIDDEESVRTLLRKTLEAAGHNVREAANGWEGLELYQAQVEDLVITDINMPEMSGLDLIGELTAHFPDVKVIAMSGSHEAVGQLQEARRLGACRTLCKPFAFADLFRAIDYELVR